MATIKQQKNKYRKYQVLANVGEYVVVPIPFVALAIVNYDEWFVNDSGWKIGLAGGLTMLLLSVATFLITKQQEKESKLTDGYVSLMLGWIMTSIIFTLIADIAQDISNIMWVGATGIAAAFGLDIARNSFKTKADKYKQDLENAQSELNKQQAMQEIIADNSKKIKVKVKK